MIVQLFVTERQKENKTEQQDRLNEHNISYYIYKKTSSSLHAYQDEMFTKINLSEQLKKSSFKESQYYNKRQIQNSKKQHRC